MNYAKVLALLIDMDGSALWRVLMPFTELQRQGYKGIQWGAKDDDRLALIFDQFDAITIPRQHWGPDQLKANDRWVENMHKAGIAVIYEVDDDMFSDEFARRTHELFNHELEDVLGWRDSIVYALAHSDGVTVSSQRLATIVREFTDKPVKVVPNYIDLHWFKKVQKQASRQVPGLTVGWAGGNRYDSDLEAMAEAWGRIAERYPHITFVVQGHQPSVIFAKVPNERIHVLPWSRLQEYPQGLINIDIGCCPLANNHFNRAKTYIKAMEYAASGAAVIVSPTIYGKIIKDGVDGYIARNADEWEDKLSVLIEDYRHRHDVAKKLLAKVRKFHSLEANAWRWLEAWNGIVEDFRYRQKFKIYLPKGVQVNANAPA